jgi:hypothetical protein
MRNRERGPMRRERDSARRYLRRLALQIIVMAVFLALMPVVVLPWVTNALATGLVHTIQ